MKSFLCELILSCAVLSGAGKPIDELTYGTILFAYFQDDFEQALLDTAVAQGQERRGEDTLRFDLARGSFAFHERMFATAQEIFASIPPEELTDTDQMRLAFHLAREYHRRGDWSQMETQLASIELGSNWRGKYRHHPEVEFMRLEGQIATGRLNDARSTFELVDEDHPLSAYAAFNLGVALRAADDRSAALQTFARLAERIPRDRESFDLIQRAKLAMAILARELDQPADAQTLLRQLPGQGRYQNVALASYGDVAMDRGNHELAARIWLTIKKDPSWTGATSAARLKFPLSLEHLDSPGAALDSYREAEEGFEQRLAYVRDMSTNVRDPAWLRATLTVFSLPERNPEDMDELMSVWRLKLGHTDWLEWLATEPVHEVLTQWRELEDQRIWLDQLPERVAILEEVSNELAARRERVSSVLADQALLDRQVDLQAGIERSAARIAAINESSPTSSTAWMGMLADEDQRVLLDELDGMQDLIELGMDPTDQAAYLGRVARLRGLVFWEITDQKARRMRELAKDLKQSTDLAAENAVSIDRLTAAYGEFSAGVQTDLYSFVDRADAITVQIAQAQAVREERLAVELKRGMDREVQQLEKFLLATRIAIARASDHLAMEGAP